MKSLQVGFIGLGNIGLPMAKSILKSGLPLTVCDLRKEPVAAMVALGAKAAGSPRDLAAACDVVLSMVRDIPQTDTVIFGQHGVWDGIREGAIIILSSTLNPAYCREVYARAKERGVRVIDAAVSKESPVNKEGEFTLMIGGDEDAVKRCRPVFKALAKHIFYLGGIGSGQAYKLVNNMVTLGCGSLIREALNLGLKAGLDLEKMIEVMRVSTADSFSLRVMEYRVKTRQPSKPIKNAPREVVNKDLEMALQMAAEVGAPLPITRYITGLDTGALYEAFSAEMK